MSFISRRHFLNRSAITVGAGSIASSLSIANAAHAAGSDVLRIALIGCGARGTGAAIQALSNTSMPNVKLVALADAFKDRPATSLSAIKTAVKDHTKIDVPKEQMFAGFDAYQKAIDSGVDVVLICAPPGFRPDHFEAAVKADAHVFMEKPLAVDAPGVRKISKVNELAKRKGLAVAVGHHLRHEEKYNTIVDQIHDGAIGQIEHMRTYFSSGGVWVRPRKPGQTEMEYQMNNWYYFNWLSGDHIVEQHVHNLDICNWFVKDAHPVEAQGMGGRQVRVGKEYGEIYDHHAVEYTYADGLKMFSYTRHMPGCWGSFLQQAQGSKGEASLHGYGGALLKAADKSIKIRRGPNGYQPEHNHLFAAIKDGHPYNECDRAVNSTMTAILGRMATYSGKIITWKDAIASELDFAPKRLAWDAEPRSKPGPDGLYPCAVPGVTRVI